MRQWELDSGSLRADHSMLTGSTGEHTVKPIFNIGDGQASHPHGQPGDSFAQVFYDLQSDLGVLKDQFFKLAAADFFLNASRLSASSSAGSMFWNIQRWPMQVGDRSMSLPAIFSHRQAIFSLNTDFFQGDSNHLTQYHTENTQETRN